MSSKIILKAEDLTKAFGGLMAVHQVGFEIHEGEIIGLIGPNGAGKTTVFNLISGLIPPDDGRIFLDGREITHGKPYRKSLLGIGRTFQVARPFEGMTVLENIMVPLLARQGSARDARNEGMAVIEQVKLAEAALADPQSLTVAQRKRVEVARALATRPRLLLLDEVLAGLNPVEVADALPLISRIRREGMTIFMIEHIMNALMSVSDRVLVMDQGRLIAAGTPEEVTANPQVIEAYLGEENPHAWYL